MGLVASHISIPIATGERLHTVHEFEMLLRRGAVQYVRPDVCMVGGLTHAKKIAAVAEAHYVGVVPHNPLSPVSTAACLQLAACIPNFALQEYPTGEHEPPKIEIVKSALRVENGFLIVSDAPASGWSWPTMPRSAIRHGRERCGRACPSTARSSTSRCRPST